MYKFLQAKREQELLSQLGIIPEDTHFCAQSRRRTKDRSQGIEASVHQLL
jgi:hypothetical protein